MPLIFFFPNSALTRRKPFKNRFQKSNVYVPFLQNLEVGKARLWKHNWPYLLLRVLSDWMNQKCIFYQLIHKEIQLDILRLTLQGQKIFALSCSIHIIHCCNSATNENHHSIAYTACNGKWVAKFAKTHFSHWAKLTAGRERLAKN